MRFELDTGGKNHRTFSALEVLSLNQDIDVWVGGRWVAARTSRKGNDFFQIWLPVVIRLKQTRTFMSSLKLIYPTASVQRKKGLVQKVYFCLIKKKLKKLDIELSTLQRIV